MCSPYSPPQGTPAYDFPDQVHEREKQARSREMNALAEQVRWEVLAAHVGSGTRCCWKRPFRGTLFTGYTRLYIPVVVLAPRPQERRDRSCRLGSTMANCVRAALC